MSRHKGPEKRDGERQKTSLSPSDSVRLFISLGTNVGMRPGDLVGAIANEAGISVKDIGAIRIEERHSTVEVARGHVEKVIEALSMTTLRGRPVKVSRDRGGTYAPPIK